MVTVHLAVLPVRVAATVAVSSNSKLLATSRTTEETPQAITSLVDRVEETVMVKFTTNLPVMGALLGSISNAGCIKRNYPVRGSICAGTVR